LPELYSQSDWQYFVSFVRGTWLINWIGATQAAGKFSWTASGRPLYLNRFASNAGNTCAYQHFYYYDWHDAPCTGSANAVCVQPTNCYGQLCVGGGPTAECPAQCKAQLYNKLFWSGMSAGVGTSQACYCRYCQSCPAAAPDPPPCMEGWAHVPPYCYWDSTQVDTYYACETLCQGKKVRLPEYQTDKTTGAAQWQQFLDWGTYKGGFSTSVWIGMNDLWATANPINHDWLWTSANPLFVWTSNGAQITAANFGWPGHVAPWRYSDPDGITSWASAGPDCRCTRAEKAASYLWMDDGCDKGTAAGSGPGWDCVCQYDQYATWTNAALNQANSYTLPVAPAEPAMCPFY